MNKLIVLSGVPGSGKSYFSHTLKSIYRSHVYIVSSDELRKLITGDISNLKEDELVWKMFYSLAEVYSKDKDGVVVLDATNFNSEKRVKDTEHLKPLFDEVDLVCFTLDEETTLTQNFQRENPLDIKVMKQFFKIYELPNEVDKAYFNHIVYVKSNNVAEAIEMLNIKIRNY